jgi:hypothetical protein
MTNAKIYQAERYTITLLLRKVPGSNLGLLDRIFVVFLDSLPPGKFRDNILN